MNKETIDLNANLEANNEISRDVSLASEVSKTLSSEKQAQIDVAIKDARDQIKFWREKLSAYNKQQDEHEINRIKSSINGEPIAEPISEELKNNFREDIKNKINSYTEEFAKLNKQDLAI
ncbi:hypothetical protein IT400_03815 [Candidatus Nomurabacteria bacterium]|nr:hypothetical protein [Candidatus Nomurabacteria bacterium]